MDVSHTTLMRRSLAVVWLATALVSVWERDGQSTALMIEGGVQSPIWVNALIWSGAIFDALLGLLLWRFTARWIYLLALVVMILMTLMASLMLPDLWLHPLGPLTKNIPLAVMLWLLWKDAR